MSGSEGSSGHSAGDAPAPVVGKKRDKAKDFDLKKWYFSEALVTFLYVDILDTTGTPHTIACVDTGVGSGAAVHTGRSSDDKWRDGDDEMEAQWSGVVGCNGSDVFDLTQPKRYYFIASGGYCYNDSSSTSPASCSDFDSPPSSKSALFYGYRYPAFPGTIFRLTFSGHRNFTFIIIFTFSFVGPGA
ncbi:hypothetical protein L1887_44273 [Cichorium endivia]|nr:hypothetical protein L1887_44273 [Cichorium endivia]